MNNKNHESEYRRQEEVRRLRLAHASLMEKCDRYFKEDNFRESLYWFDRAKETEARIRALGEEV